MIATLTTSRRPDLFKQTIESFTRKAKDWHLIDGLHIFDDGSSLQDIQEMATVMSETDTKWECSGKATPRGHALNMQEVWTAVVIAWLSGKHQYCLHLEDDWELVSTGCPILAALDIMECNPKIGQVGFGVPTLRWKNRRRTRTGVQYMVRPALIDHDYPAFTLNPSVIRVAALKDVGNFEAVPQFEKAYGLRWNAKGWVTADLFPHWLRHLGDGNSAYDKNGTVR